MTKADKEFLKEQKKLRKKAEKLAPKLIGQDTRNAEAWTGHAGLEFRVVKSDGKPKMITRDHRIDRINVTDVERIVTAAYIG